MAVTPELARLAKILVDREGIPYPEAEARLQALTLEIIVGPETRSATAQTAILTAVNLARRSFVGGVRLVGSVNGPLNTPLPLPGVTLAAAAAGLGAREFAGPALQRLSIGAAKTDDPETIGLWWNGWRAGAGVGAQGPWLGDNPLAGIAAAALGVGQAFLKASGRACVAPLEIELWGEGSAPPFETAFLPGALWLVGLGNLGQAYLWTLAALPYADPSQVALVLQDQDRVSPENWATSVLVSGDAVYGVLKTKVAEAWAEARGFEVRRVDRRLTATDRLDDQDPRLALSGLDRFEARKAMGQVGFEVIVDAGLGRTAEDFDGFRVSVFDSPRPIDRHFADMADAVAGAPADAALQKTAAYQALADEIGACGMAQMAGASAAAPFVSALASALVVSRLIALASNQPMSPSEVGRLSRLASRRRAPAVAMTARGVRHAGRATTINS